jgi:CubicO group peptidase (beta-lactamase class C family)
MQPEAAPERPLAAAEMGLMQGSPPPPERRVTLAQWQGPPWNRWAYQHISQVIPTARIWRGDGGVTPLPPDPVDVDDIAFETIAGERTTVGALLQRTYTDGFLVLRDGRIASEQYFNGMLPHTRHLLQSVSKSITGALAGALVGRGLLDAEGQLEDYVPELRDTSFSGATVRHLLDMSAGTRFSEDYDNPQSDIRLYEGAAGWRPAAPHEADLDLFGYILTLPNVRPHGGVFDYRSILTDLLGVVLERAAGMRCADALSDMIWAPIGPEEDAEITVDRVGSPMTDGGVSVTLRDLARFGQMYLHRGLVDGRQVVPAAWVDDTRHADETCKRAFAASETAIRYPKGHYRNQWWVPDAEAGVLLASGIHGQSLYVHMGLGVVVAKLSSLPVAYDLDIYADQHRAYTAVAAALAG